MACNSHRRPDSADNGAEPAGPQPFPARVMCRRAISETAINWSCIPARSRSVNREPPAVYRIYASVAYRRIMRVLLK